MPVTTVLVVCTANVCRSPMAAALLAARCHDSGSSARVWSAGTHAMSSEVASDAVAVLADRGIDISGHTPRLLDRDDVSRADLILTMECAHVAHVVAIDAAAFRKTFAVRELAARADRSEPKRADETLDDYLSRQHRGRRAADVLRSADEWDVADPMGQGRRAFETCATELEGLMVPIAEMLR